MRSSKFFFVSLIPPPVDKKPRTYAVGFLCSIASKSSALLIIIDISSSEIFILSYVLSFRATAFTCNVNLSVGS